MFSSFRSAFLAAAGWGVTALTALAQTHSAPVGFQAYAFASTTTAEVAYIAVPLHGALLYSGTPTVVTANTLTVENANWATGAFLASAGGTAAHVRFTSGAQSGRALPILAHTTSQLTLDLTDGTKQSTPLNTTGFAVTTADTFEICAADTLEELFGSASDTSVFPGRGTSAEAAGSIGLWNATVMSFESYYFDSSVSHWVKAGTATSLDAGQTIVPPQATIAIQRPAGSAASRLLLAGRAPAVAPRLKHSGGGTVRYFSSHFPVPLTFAQLSLGANWVKGNSAFVADTLSLPSGTTTLSGVSVPTWESYYQRTDGEWRKSGSTVSQNATVIPAGTGVTFLKRASVSGSTSFLTLALPFTP